jgi:hypothetical protein
MVIGHLGSGAMSITNGGQVYSLGPNPQQPTPFVVGAVIGSDPMTTTQQPPFAGGQGTATVDGVGSKWIVGGSFQIGGFDNTKFIGTPANQGTSISGGTAQYLGNTGRGILNVTNGGVVSLVAPPVDPTGLGGGFNLDLVVGLYGQIHMAGGSIQIDNGSVASSGGGNVTPNILNYRLINDGTIGGSGTITIGQFRNRSLGRRKACVRLHWPIRESGKR